MQRRAQNIVADWRWRPTLLRSESGDEHGGARRDFNYMQVRRPLQARAHSRPRIIARSVLHGPRRSCGRRRDGTTPPPPTKPPPPTLAASTPRTCAPEPTGPPRIMTRIQHQVI